CGGHIHFGLPRIVTARLDVSKLLRHVARAIDVMRFNPQTRIESRYATEGAFEEKAYGFEWRDLPAAVLCSRKSRSRIAAIARLVVELIFCDEDRSDAVLGEMKRVAEGIESGVELEINRPVVYLDRYGCEFDACFIDDMVRHLPLGRWYVLPLKKSRGEIYSLPITEGERYQCPFSLSSGAYQIALPYEFRNNQEYRLSMMAKLVAAIKDELKKSKED
ncbi:MAG: hypothetical protein NZM12_09945, partial [Steroidobacteraceae bacterium]|nr:hypothetical protein [Steroidobacteraceae bacterium]